MGWLVFCPLSILHTMVQQILAKILLFPFSLLYGLGVALRNFFYQQGLLKAISFNIPLISVGNLSVGGSGKTPHIEYLIRLLKDYLEVATLSRGYRRKTRGFIWVEPHMTAEAVGDEPLQYKRKFPEISVTVSEDRAFAVPQIVGRKPETQLVLLDDAFQHRAVKPGLQILLTEYARPFTRDWLLPSGRLREWRSAYRRADVLIVSKCPKVLTRSEANRVAAEIKPQAHQRIYFSYYEYGRPYLMLDQRYKLELSEDIEVLLISAIANTDYLLEHLDAQTKNVRSIEFADHHFFSQSDMATLLRAFNNIEGPRKYIITTEKDAMRLELHRQLIIEQKLPVFVLPIRVQFHFGEGPQFDEQVQQHLLAFKA